MSQPLESLERLTHHFQNAQVDILESELSKRFSEQAAQLTALQKLNTELLEQIHEYKTNDLDRSIMQKNLAEQQNSYLDYREELNRKLAKLTDECWDKDLELDNLRALVAAEQAKVVAIKEENEKIARDAEHKHLHELESMQETNAALHVQISQLRRERSELETDFEDTKNDFEASLVKVRAERDQQTADLEKQLAAVRAESEKQLTALSTSSEAQLKALTLEADARYSKLQSESEAKVLALQATLAASEAVLEKTKTELMTTQDSLSAALQSEEELNQKLMKTEAALSEKTQSLVTANDLIAELERGLVAKTNEIQDLKDESLKALNGMNLQNAQNIEMFKSRENQLTGELSRLRIEHANMAKEHKDACLMAGELRFALDNVQADAQRNLGEIQIRMQAEFQKQFETVLGDNVKLRQLLNVRDTHTETERNNLKQWQEQLNFLDQHLRQAKESAKKDRGELLRVAKQMAAELEVVRKHPFNEYLELAEIEIAKLQSQLSSISSLSPLRAKIQERLTDLVDQTDYMKSVLSGAQKELQERTTIVAQILKSASTPV